MWKGYAMNDTFKMNLDINKNLFSAYMLSSFNIWHVGRYFVNKRLI